MKLFIERNIEGDGNGYPLTPDDELNKFYNAYMMKSKDGLKSIGWVAMHPFKKDKDLD